MNQPSRESLYLNTIRMVDKDARNGGTHPTAAALNNKNNEFAEAPNDGDILPSLNSIPSFGSFNVDRSGFQKDALRSPPDFLRGGGRYNNSTATNAADHDPLPENGPPPELPRASRYYSSLQEALRTPPTTTPTPTSPLAPPSTPPQLSQQNSKSELHQQDSPTSRARYNHNGKSLGLGIHSSISRFSVYAATKSNNTLKRSATFTFGKNGETRKKITDSISRRPTQKLIKKKKKEAEESEGEGEEEEKKEEGEKVVDKSDNSRNGIFSRAMGKIFGGLKGSS